MRGALVCCAGLMLVAGCEERTPPDGGRAGEGRRSTASLAAGSWEVSTRESLVVRAVGGSESSENVEAFLGVGTLEDDGRGALVRLTLHGSGQAEVFVDPTTAPGEPPPGDSYFVAWRRIPHVITTRVRTGTVGVAEIMALDSGQPASFGVRFVGDKQIIVVPASWKDGVKVSLLGPGGSMVSVGPGQYVEATPDPTEPSKTVLSNVMNLSADNPGPVERFADRLESVRASANPTPPTEPTDPSGNP